MSYDDLRASLRGELLVPDQGEFETRRNTWNQLYDHEPAAVVRCRGVSDVKRTLAFAHQHALPVAVRGGGHCYAGTSSCDGGIVLDMSLMQGLRIDPVTSTAWVEAGVKWDSVFREAGALNLVVPAPPPQVGVAGATLGGGFGILSRKWGLTADNLLSADVVTADGQLVRASATQNPDLFWALRGGGGNFGVVTAFELQLHPIAEQVHCGPIIFGWSDAANVLRSFRDYIVNAPDDLGAMAMFFVVPPLPFFPEEHHYKTALSISVAWVGEPHDAAGAIDPIRAFAAPIADFVAMQPWETFKHADDAAIDMWKRVYPRSRILPELTDAAIDGLVDFAANLKGDVTLGGIGSLSGAIARVPADATAFPNRRGGFEVDLWVAWNDASQDEELIAWAHEFDAVLTPFAGDGVYVNMLAADEVERVRNAYLENWDRLRKVKTKWDPGNLFRRNHNVPPLHDA